MTTEDGIAPETAISQPKLEKEANVARVEKSVEATPKKEAEKPFDFKFYVTDHSPRVADTGSPDKLRALYRDIKKDGIEQVRYDWDWNLIEQNRGEINSDQLERFKSAAQIMKEEGLDPLIILSNPPEWAKKLYKENPGEFVTSYKNYTAEVKKAVEAAGVKPETVQVLNELNNPAYTPVTDMEVIGQLCDAAREAFPEGKIMVSFLAAAIPEAVSKSGLSENVRTFLPKLKTISDKFDKVAIDYYPGGWQRPISGEGGKIVNLIKRVVLPGTAAYKEMFKDMSLFQETAEEVASWGKQYELGETGFPTKGAYWGNEQRQRYFYDSFFRHFKHLMVDFKARGVPLPDKLGLYQAQNEPPRNFIGKLMRKTPYPEFDWGMRDEKGNRKAILQGSLRASELVRVQQESRLSRIIHYMKSPMRETQAIETQQDNQELQEVRKELSLEVLTPHEV
ncbi:MAG: hypothetical protein COY68_03230 [Candidatus Levybacteria bacterium CG_4_10_14_0_8_um_filter_35_23]|nr:MAG: hypothetical protein COY68_03230 [Candidatus Levybacteria bacterium CG_4_10_14_0_8_um_filter_35_23]